MLGTDPVYKSSSQMVGRVTLGAGFALNLKVHKCKELVGFAQSLFVGVQW